MLNHLNWIMNQIEFPSDAQDTMRQIYLKTESVLPPLIQSCFQSRNEAENQQLLADLTVLAQKQKIHPYSLYLLFYLCASKTTKEIYQKNSINEQVYIDSMKDLTVKLQECKKNYDVWGNATSCWFFRFLYAKCFALGRLQFECIPFPLPHYQGHGICLHQGDPVYNIHIPSSGPLTKEAILKSYQKAYQFFNIKGKMPVFCNSWLLYSPYKNVYPNNSNLLNFATDFQHLKDIPSPVFGDAWRVFGVKSEGLPPEQLPCETTLQQNFIEYLKNGGNSGNGMGILIFDGEKICK